jgi:DNA primase
MTISDKPDIIDTLRAEGFEAKKKGKYYWTLCPLHPENNASFKINPEKQSFRCFGCNEHGDVITFIQKYKDLSFKHALAYLKINDNGQKYFKPRQKETRKRELLREYRQWLSDYRDFLCDILWKLDQSKKKAKTMKAVEALAFHYHSAHIWEHQLEILFSKDEEAKFELYEELRYGRK